MHQHDNRTQSIHLGISHHEFGSVIAEAQRLLDDSRARADHFEGIAQTIHNQACEQIVHLKGMVESLHQSCQSKGMTISGLSTDLSALQNEVLLVRGQLEAQVSKCSTSERIIGDKDSEIQRLMNELSSSQQSLALSHEVRQQLEERLPALATDNQESAKLLPLVRNLGGYACVQSGENQSIVPASSSHDPFQGQILEALQALNARLSSIEASSPKNDQFEQSLNGAGRNDQSRQRMFLFVFLEASEILFGMILILGMMGVMKMERAMMKMN